jgi:hypothetical protein
LCGHDCLVAHLGEVSRFRIRFVFRNRFINPSLDRSAAIFVFLITDERVASEEFIEVICLAGVVRLKKGSNGWR